LPIVIRPNRRRRQSPIDARYQSMIRKSVQRFFLATNAGRACAEIMLNQKLRSAMAIQPNPIAL
jgi:hypothetical protein